MGIPFYKYHGTGNDFIIIDNRKLIFNKKKNLISNLCNRRFGIGADGLILLQDITGYDFEMVYFNADGNVSTMCGNGGRCIVDFAHRLGITGNKVSFFAVDGAHKAVINKNIISLKMQDVNEVEINPEYCLMDTGSPHYLIFTDKIDAIDVVTEGRKIRNNKRFCEEGVNVNFLEKRSSKLYMRTYERGVEDETLSCGTGMVAAALYASLKNIFRNNNFCHVETPGGEVKVQFRNLEDLHFTDIWLEGPATFIFKGEINIR